MIGFSTAIGLFVLLAVLAWTTLADERARLGTLLILAMFAVRTWVQHRRQVREQREGESREVQARVE